LTEERRDTIPPQPASEPDDVDDRGLEADPVYGKPLTNYPSDRGRLLLICGAIYALIAFVLNVAFLNVDQQVASIFVIGGMSLAALVIGWLVLHYWNREIVLYERGFSYREGSRDVFFSYGDVDQVMMRAERVSYFGGLARRTIREMRLHTIHDETLLINSLYRRIDELTTRLERLITQARYPVAEAQLSEGKALDFGAGLVLTHEGINLDGTTLIWPQFGDYSIGGGQLRLLQADGENWRHAPLATLVNAALLITLLDTRKRTDVRTSPSDHSPS
jgi:hypothetical protein